MIKTNLKAHKIAYIAQRKNKIIKQIMRITTLKVLFLMLVSVGCLKAQQITNVNTSTQNCQGDTITVSFAVISPLNAGNNFQVEISDPGGVFNGNFIEIAPLLAFGVGGYNMDAIIPSGLTQGAYKIRVFGNNPITFSDTISNVIVGALPNANISIVGSYTYNGTERYCANDTAFAIGPLPPLGESYSYRWFQNNSPMAGEINDTLILVNMSGIFSVEVTRGTCSDMSSDTIINVYTPPSSIAHTPSVDINVIGSDSIRFFVGTVATLNAPVPIAPDTYLYQWYADSIDSFGNPIRYALLNDTLQTLSIDSTGTFYVSVTALPGGCSDTSDVFSVFAAPIPAVQQITNVNTSTQNCQSDTIIVSFSVIAPLNAGNTFRVEISDQLGDFNGDFIEIAPLLAFGVGGYNMDAIIPSTLAQGAYDIRIFANNPITFSDTISNVIVGALPNTDISIFGSYTYNGTQRYCADDTVYVVGPVPPLGESHSYKWLQNGSPMAGEINDTLLLVNMSGIFSVEVTRGLCSAISSDTIINVSTPPAFVFSSPSPDIDIISVVGSDSIQFCEGTIATLNAPIPFGIDTFFYQWYTDSVDFFGTPIRYPLPGDTLQTLDVDSAGTYYVSVVSLPGGCSDTSEVFSVFVDSIPSTSIVALSSLVLCLEDSVVLTAVDTVTYPDWIYQWQGEFPLGSGLWVDAPADTNASITIDSALINLADTVSFRLKITHGTCEFITNELTVIFVQDPVFIFLPGDSVDVCLGDSLQVFAQSSTAINYNWSNGKTGATIWVTAADAPGLTCVATGINGCTYQRDLKVNIFTITADAGPDQTILFGTDVVMNGSGGTNYYWSSDLPSFYSDRFVADPTVRPNQDTTMYIMRATGTNGCIDFDTMFVYVTYEEPDTTVLDNVQNVITPNGDGRNDMLDLSDVILSSSCLVSVMDRWGREVYRQENYANTWNGTTTAGEELPDGTYYYIVKCGDDIRYKGPVTIMRNQNQ